MIDYMRNERMACQDCGHDTAAMGERYMVSNRLWGAATSDSYACMLCVGCLEARLGAKLAPGDFIDCPLNRDLQDQSLRLRSRMAKQSRLDA